MHDQERLHKTNQILENVNQLLQNRVFVGCYKERVLVKSEPRPIYKDVIDIDESEHEVIKAMKSAYKLLNHHFQGGITTCIEFKCSTSQCSVYTNLSNVTLEFHWFMIKHVTLEANIINIAVKNLRPFAAKNEAYANPSKQGLDGPLINSYIVSNIKRAFLQNVTVENLTYAVRFLSVLFLTLLIGVYNLLQLLLKAIHELNIFFHNAVPVLVACVEGITKAFGGLLILIAMMWNGNKKKLSVNNYENRNQPFAVKYQTNKVMMSSPSFRAFIESRSIAYGTHPPVVNNSPTYMTYTNPVYKRDNFGKHSPITTPI